MKRVLSRSAILAAVAFLAVLATFAAVPAAHAAQCFSDGDGSGPSGPLQTHSWLKVDYINESTWYGNDYYWAERRYSNSSLSYFVEVYGGNWQYGTSGNAYRRTAIDSAGGIVFSWTVIQYKIC